MRTYIRSRTPGATYFFTVALQDRTARTLVEHFGHLRAALSRVKDLHPFHIDAMVVLPEHLHALWTLPPGDCDFPLRWRLFKRGFTRRLLCAGVLEPPQARRRGVAEAHCGSAGIGNTRCGTRATMRAMSTTSISIP